MEAAAEKKQREEKDGSKVEKTKDKELEELRAENAKLKSGELSSLRALLKEEEAEAWKKAKGRRGSGKGPDTYTNAAAASSGSQQQEKSGKTGKDGGKNGNSSAGKGSKKGKDTRGGR